MMTKSNIDEIPKYKELLNPTLEAIRALGGSASVKEIENAVIEKTSELLAKLQSATTPGCNSLTGN